MAYRDWLNKKYGRVGTVQDELPDGGIAEHDRRHHPDGYQEGDTCKYREELAKSDEPDAAVAPNAAVAQPRPVAPTDPEVERKNRSDRVHSMLFGFQRLNVPKGYDPEYMRWADDFIHGRIPIDEVEPEIRRLMAEEAEKMASKPPPRSMEELSGRYAASVALAQKIIADGDENVAADIGDKVRDWNRIKKAYDQARRKVVEARREVVASIGRCIAGMSGHGLTRSLNDLAKAECVFSQAEYVLESTGREIDDEIVMGGETDEDTDWNEKREQLVAAIRAQNLRAEEGWRNPDDPTGRRGMVSHLRTLMAHGSASRPFSEEVMGGYDGIPLEMVSRFCQSIKDFQNTGNGKSKAYSQGRTVVMDVALGGDYRGALLHESGHAALKSLGIEVHVKRKVSPGGTEAAMARLLSPIMAAARRETETFAVAKIGKNWKSLCRQRNAGVVVANHQPWIDAVMTTMPESSESIVENKPLNAVADIFCAATDGNQFWGHAKKYYANLHAPLHEVVANITQLVCTAPQTAETIFPETTKAVKRLVYGMEV